MQVLSWNRKFHGAKEPPFRFPNLRALPSYWHEALRPTDSQKGVFQYSWIAGERSLSYDG